MKLSKKKSLSTTNLGEGRGRSSFLRSEEVGGSAERRISQVVRRTWQAGGGSAMADDFADDSRDQVCSFVGGLGPGQLIGRHILGYSCLGKVQVGIAARNGYLEVEVVRARNLVLMSGAAGLPATHIKVYMLDGKSKCVEKQKTSKARRTLDPLHQETFIFRKPFSGRILMVIVWGDYGIMESKVFMGVAQIALDNVDLTSPVIGWYRLYHSSSLVSTTPEYHDLPRMGRYDVIPWSG